MSRATRLYDRHTEAELVAKLQEVQERQRKIPGDIHLLSPKDGKLSDDLAWAISWKMRDRVAGQGAGE